MTSRIAVLLPAATLVTIPLPAFAFNGPADAKAQKTFAQAKAAEADHKRQDALDLYKKADKQDNNACGTCAEQVVTLALVLNDYKQAVEASNELLALAKTPAETAAAHVYRGVAELRMGNEKHKQELYTAADQDLQAALAVSPHDRTSLYADGMALAHLSQDDAARERFQAYLKYTTQGSADRQRAERYVSRPELARATMAPGFIATTIDGKRLSLDDLAGKVVLLDFWATWCGPCREALPHVQRIAQKFNGQPLVVISVSLDKDDAKWRSFVAEHQMTWLQIRNSSEPDNLATLFSVHSIPQTFTIDADGVLQDRHLGDANIEGELRKLVAQAQQQKAQPRPGAPATEDAKLPGQ